MTTRPRAPEDELATRYFRWHEQGELRLQRCADCDSYLHPPRVTCPWCHGTALTWEPVSGDGTVFTWIVTRRALTAGSAALGAGYVSALVELTEGPRLLTLLLGVEPEDVTAGMPVSVTFEPDATGVLRAMFRPAGPSTRSARSSASRDPGTGGTPPPR